MPRKNQPSEAAELRRCPERLRGTAGMLMLILQLK